LPNGFGLLSLPVLLRQPIRIGGFTDRYSPFYTAFERKMRRCFKLPVPCLYAVAGFFLLAPEWLPTLAKEAPQKPAEKPAAKNSEKTGPPERAENPAQIELLETKVRFETNGDSRKEVHALVKINSELGVRQFARLNFDFNRSFESVETPQLHITHASGGTADILPGAITNQPNPAVVNAPAYQDVRVKSVRILGLQPGDRLEYRVIRTVSHHPLAPDFWLDHTFDRTGVVSREIFELDLPASRFEARPPDLDARGLPIQRLSTHGAERSMKPGQIYVSPKTPETSRDRVMQGDTARLILRWSFQPKDKEKPIESALASETEESDVALSTFATWPDLAIALGGSNTKSWSTADLQKLREMAGLYPRERDPIREYYERVSRKIRTVDLPFDVCLALSRNTFETLSDGYGTAYAKARLFEDLTVMLDAKMQWLLFSPGSSPENQLPRPSVFSAILLEVGGAQHRVVVDPSMEVAPYGLVSANMRGRKALQLNKCPFDESRCWVTIPNDLPFSAKQQVAIDGVISPEGKLSAKVHYSMRGDNELVLRVAFHQSPKEKWKELAQLLSITDGFRGQVTSVNASDPYATKEPFSVEYDIEQPKFVDWSKKTVRIPALLPQLGLPDPAAKSATGSATTPIELGTPLEVETQMTLHLPAGTAAQTPTGTSVERDYATYASQYSVKGSALTASRHIRFLLRQIPGARAADYNAFLHAVQSDEAQDFTLERSETSPSKTNSAAPNTTASPKTAPPNPRFLPNL
jgi:hypothetical protein